KHFKNTKTVNLLIIPKLILLYIIKNIHALLIAQTSDGNLYSLSTNTPTLIANINTIAIDHLIYQPNNALYPPLSPTQLAITKTSIHTTSAPFFDRVFIDERGFLYYKAKDRHINLNYTIFDILHEPKIINTAVLTVCKNVITYYIEDIVVFIISYVLNITDEDYKKKLYYNHLYTPFERAERNVKICDGVLRIDQQFYNVQGLNFIMNVYCKKIYCGGSYLENLHSDGTVILYKTPKKLHIGKFLIFLVIIFVIVLYKYSRSEIIRLNNVLCEKKGYKLYEGIFDSSKVIVKVYKKDDSKGLNEIYILKKYHRTGIIKYFCKDENKKELRIALEHFTQINRKLEKKEIFDIIILLYQLQKKRVVYNNLGVDNIVFNKSGFICLINFEDASIIPKKDLCVDNDLNIVKNASEKKTDGVLHDFVNDVNKNKSVKLNGIQDEITNTDQQKNNSLNKVVHHKKEENLELENKKLLDNENSISNQKKTEKNLRKGNKKHKTNSSSMINSYDKKEKTIIGTENWRPSEVIAYNNGISKLTEAMKLKVDVFSIGILLYYNEFKKNPFGVNEEIEENITKGIFKLEFLKDFVLHDLICNCIKDNFNERLSMQNVINHPYFWSEEKRFNFIANLSDYIENQNEESKRVYLRLERNKSKLFNKKWNILLDDVIVEELKNFRFYNFTSTKGLLRVIRNKGRHFKEIPDDIKNIYGSFPNEFMDYFIKRFPSLIMTCYYSAKCSSHEEMLSPFYDSFT
ncbi:Serine/threonine-protein kinase/endoribonuclease IRE1, partial [Conglomerata obtusa]